jgi:hypothetical protein
MSIGKDPIFLRITDSRRKERDEMTKWCLKIREKQEASQERLAEIRAKSQAALQKLWSKRWSKED